MPSKGAPVKVPTVRHSTAAWRSEATTLCTVVSASGRAANSPAKNSRTSPGPRITRRGTMSSTPSSLQQAAIASGSRAWRAPK